MSFFGFDTSMPLGMGRSDEDMLEERLRRMAEEDENLEIYDFGGGDGAEAGGVGGLNETLDEFNDDTFGAPIGNVGKDFDFAGNTASFTGGTSTAVAPVRILPQVPVSKGAPNPFGFASSSFGSYVDPLLGPGRPLSSRDYRRPLPNAAAPASKISVMQQQTLLSQRPVQQIDHAQIAKPPQARTLAEIEAEMAMQRSDAMRVRQPSAPQASAPRTLTMQEVEAEMMNRARLRTEPVINLMPQTTNIAIPSAQVNDGGRSDALSALFPALPGSSAQNGTIAYTDPDFADNIEARIREAEAQEGSRRRKAAKIVRMAKHNGLMTQGDKDFITRIQVSQLINSSGPGGSHDPYVEDFYFAVMQSLKQNRALAQQQRTVQPPSAGAGMPGVQQQSAQGGHRGRQHERQKVTRRDNAMNRMAQQVQRLVDDANKKPRSSQLSLEGALGKIAIRTRSAPRPLLQFDSKQDDGAITAASSSLSSSLNRMTIDSSQQGHKAMTRKEVLIGLERVYDIILKLEQLRRQQPSFASAAAAETNLNEMHERAGNVQLMRTNAQQAIQAQEAEYNNNVQELWKSLRIMDPLDVCRPHPFIALLSANKGKKALPRALRHLSAEQTLTILTLLVATFDTLDVVVDSHILDANPNDSSFIATQAIAQGKMRKQVETETETFLNAAIPLVIGTVGKSPLKIVTGMLGLLMERNDLLKLAKSKPGLAFLTLFVSRGHHLKEVTAEKATNDDPLPDKGELSQWSATFNHLFDRLSSHLPLLYPSTRNVPFGPGLYTSGFANTIQQETILDAEDEPVWHFLAAMAVCSDMNQQQILVTEVRDKVLENVMKAKNAVKQAPGAAGEAVSAAKIRNVNVFLHALGLDASQLAPE